MTQEGKKNNKPKISFKGAKEGVLEHITSYDFIF